MLHKHAFIEMVKSSLLGAIIGLIAGLLLGLIIQAISSVTLPLSMMMSGPQVMAPFLGMGFGTIVGALLGGAVSMKK
jgi:uncharacterized membrane protein